MKRIGNLLTEIADRENLRLAVHRALCGKRDRLDARQFVDDLDRNLAWMRACLLDGDFPVGRQQQFTIYDPKERLITAPCFRERVLHHAIMNICEPHFERQLIDDTYACRRGKGRIAALSRAKYFSRRYSHALKLDIRKYFDSVSHSVLFGLLSRRFKDAKLLNLFQRILAAYETTPGRGLPIGSLTSQHFANFFLGPFDRYVKEQLRVKGYVRYMDDSVLWGRRGMLHCCFEGCQSFLCDKLDLTLKTPNRVVGAKRGWNFLGCRVFPEHLVLNRRSRKRFRQKLAALERRFQTGEIHQAEFQQRALSLVAFTRAGNVASWRHRRRVLEQMPEMAQGLEPGEPWRQLEQHAAELPVGEP